MRLAQLARFAGHHKVLVIGAWLVIFLAALPFTAKQTEKLFGGGSEASGTQSAQLREIHERAFPRHELGIVVQFSPQATADQRRAALERVENGVASEPLVRAKHLRNDSAQSTLVVPLATHSQPHKLVKVAGELRSRLQSGKELSGATVFVYGDGAYWNALDEESGKQLSRAELIGFPIVLLILLVAFGTLSSALLPLSLGVVAVTVTGAEAYLLSGAIDMSLYVKNIASMIGIGVAVDYSLFIVARYREEIAEGRSHEDARARSLASSGKAVVFSGIAVILSVATIFLVDNQALRSMAVGAILVVATAVLAAITLLPALMTLLEKRLSGKKRTETSRFWTRWTEGVMARPWLTVCLTSAFLIVVALPTFSMQTGVSPVGLLPKDNDVRVGLSLASKADPAAAPGIDVVAPKTEVARVETKITEIAAPRSLTVATGSGGLVSIHATTDESVDSESANKTVSLLRAKLKSARVIVGGEAARIQDVSSQIEDAMPRLILAMLLLAFGVLSITLRSILLPLKAILLNLLSIGVAFGVLVMVFQWGWLDGLFGFESLGRINSITPPLVVTVVFGLSMDYQVFLLARIREQFESHGDNTRAVAHGLASSARTITSAALIMVCVFLVFVGTGVPTIQEIGLGCAVAIAIDATLVRLLLVPASMTLLGRWNWWLPFRNRDALASRA